MKRRGRGWIVNVSSLAGKHPFAGGVAYCASKAGLNALTESLMQDVRRDGIRVSCVLPGSVNTEFGGGRPSAGADWKLDASDVARAVVDLLRHPVHSLPSRVELRPSRPAKVRLLGWRGVVGRLAVETTSSMRVRRVGRHAARRHAHREIEDPRPVFRSSPHRRLRGGRSG